MTVGCIQTGQPDAGPPRRLRLRHHLRDEQGVRLRLPPRRAEAAPARRRRHRKSFEQAFLGPERPRRGGRRPSSAPTTYAIVDEADSILIDEARTPLIIGANNQPTQEEAAAYYGADELAATLVRIKDFKYDPAERKAELNAAGRRKVQAVAGHSSFVTLTVDGLYEYVERALRAQIAYLKDRDYVVVNGEIVIVDEFTGRMMPGRQWQDGLHQAIQAKEQLEVTLETITAARVTVQDFFLRYKKLAGMTGTAVDRRRRAAADLQGQRLQGPDQPPGPPGLGRRPRLLDRGREVPGRRRPDRRLAQAAGVPVLIGTRSIEKSEKLSALLNGREDRAPDPQRQEPRDRGPDRRRRPGQPGRGDGGDQHGRPRDRHQAGRGGRRAAAACTSSAPSGTSRGGSTASSPAAAPARATPATASSSSRSRTRSSRPSARSPPPASASATATEAS